MCFLSFVYSIAGLTVINPIKSKIFDRGNLAGVGGPWFRAVVFIRPYDYEAPTPLLEHPFKIQNSKSHYLLG